MLAFFFVAWNETTLHEEWYVWDSVTSSWTFLWPVCGKLLWLPSLNFLSFYIFTFHLLLALLLLYHVVSLLFEIYYKQLGIMFFFAMLGAPLFIISLKREFLVCFSNLTTENRSNQILFNLMVIVSRMYCTSWWNWSEFLGK